MNFLGYEITPKSMPLFIAELSCNHCGKIENVLKLIDLAKRSRADIVKIQVYSPEEMTFPYKKGTPIQKGIWKGKTLYELYSSTQTPEKWLPEIFAYAKKIDIKIFASVFGEKSFSALEKVGCEAYKIASYEANDFDLIKKVASSKKPMILSTGSLEFPQIQNAANQLPQGYPLFFMHCESSYPCADANASLYRMKALQMAFGDLKVGYSDHTKGAVSATFASILGAKFIEKHFHAPTVLGSKSEDARFSMSPTQFKNMVMRTRRALEMCHIKPRTDQYVFNRSLYVVKPIKKGEDFNKYNTKALRPYKGLDPYMLPRILGLRSNTNIPAGTPLIGDYVQWPK